METAIATQGTPARNEWAPGVREMAVHATLLGLIVGIGPVLPWNRAFAVSQFFTVALAVVLILGLLGTAYFSQTYYKRAKAALAENPTFAGHGFVRHAGWLAGGIAVLSPFLVQLVQFSLRL